MLNLSQSLAILVVNLEVLVVDYVRWRLDLDVATRSERHGFARGQAPKSAL